MLPLSLQQQTAMSPYGSSSFVLLVPRSQTSTANRATAPAGVTSQIVRSSLPPMTSVFSSRTSTAKAAKDHASMISLPRTVPNHSSKNTQQQQQQQSNAASFTMDATSCCTATTAAPRIKRRRMASVSSMSTLNVASMLLSLSSPQADRPSPDSPEPTSRNGLVDCKNRCVVDDATKEDRRPPSGIGSTRPLHAPSLPSPLSAPLPSPVSSVKSVPFSSASRYAAAAIAISDDEDAASTSSAHAAPGPEPSRKRKIRAAAAALAVNEEDSSEASTASVRPSLQLETEKRIHRRRVVCTVRPSTKSAAKPERSPATPTAPIRADTESATANTRPVRAVSSTDTDRQLKPCLPPIATRDAVCRVANLPPTNRRFIGTPMFLAPNLPSLTAGQAMPRNFRGPPVRRR